MFCNLHPINSSKFKIYQELVIGIPYGIGHGVIQVVKAQGVDSSYHLRIGMNVGRGVIGGISVPRM